MSDSNFTASHQPTFAMEGHRWAGALSAAAGFADAIGYLQVGVFAANMTGNTVLAGVALARGDWTRVGVQAMTICAFFAGALGARTIGHISSRRESLILLLEAILLLAAAFETEHQGIAITLIAAAMGAQATATPKFAGTAVSTVVVTSTIARFAESAADSLRHIFRAGPRPLSGHGTFLLGTWMCYFVGAVSASMAVPLLTNPLALSAGLVLFLSLILEASASRTRQR